MLSVLMTYIRSFVRQNEQGQDLIEYAMLGGLIALAIIGVAIAALTGALDQMFEGIGNCVDFDNTTGCQPF